MGNRECPWCEEDAQQEDFEIINEKTEKTIDEALDKTDLGAGVERGWQETGKCEHCGAEWVAGEATVTFLIFTKDGNKEMRV